jgi:SAM-dependent methyltransferase
MHAAASCPLCGRRLGDAEVVHLEPDRFERAVKIPAEGYARAWRRCTGCAALVNVQRPEDAAVLDRMASNYYEVDLGTGIGAKFEKVMALPQQQSDNAGRVQRVADACRRFLPAGGGPALAIDVGAGTGVFLSCFLPAIGHGWQAVAIEPDPLAAAHLRSLAQFDVIEGLFDKSLSLEPADLITFNKVIEHIREPRPVLEAAVARMKPDGLVYVEVPDALTAICCEPRDNILGALHKHIYEPETLAALLRGVGLATLKVVRLREPSGKYTVYAFACRADRYRRNVK